MSPSAEGHPERTILIKGPKARPEPALGFSKKNPDCPKKSGVPRRHVACSNKTTKVLPQQPGGRANVFFVLSYYYVNVTFSSTLRYRSGRNVSVYVTLP